MAKTKLQYTESDFDTMVDELIACNGNVSAFVENLLNKGYALEKVEAFARTIDAIKDKLMNLDDNECREKLIAIKAYCILRINVSLMPDNITPKK